MKTMDFVKVLKLNQSNLDDERKVVNVTDDNITKLSSYNFLIKILETYNNNKFINNELITEFIKINLPHNEEQAHTQWFDGIEYEGKKYYAWFATVGGMKKEDNGICDTMFIREDYQGFAELVENLISLGKFKELESLDDEDPKKTICINKDVLSRISLITSDLITEIDIPNIIVLPQATYHIIKDYKTVEPFEYEVTTEKTNSKGEVTTKTETKIDYNLIDYHFDDDIDIFDGGGIATPKVFCKIGNALNRQDIDFAIIRGYGLGIKGLITRFDILKYLNVFYKEDTQYCRKTEKGYELLDRWGDWQIVTDNTMLLNESMVKLAKYYKTENDENMATYKDLLNKLNNDKYMSYYNLLNKLYITKVNKPAEEITDYRRTNYQLINALALTPKKYRDLTKQDIKAFSKIIKPYTCIKGESDTKEFVINTDYINLFYKQCVKPDIDEKDEDFEEKVKENVENIVDKVNELININEEFVKLNFVKSNLRKLIEKKVRELAAGKVTVRAKYQYIAVDPISYMNFAMTREQGENGLKQGEFYSEDCNNNDVRTIQRNPLSAYSEVHNVKFIRNPFVDNWLSSCRELIYFNQKSDILSLISSADCDGDACTVIDEEIIKKAVIVPKDNKYFITKNDGAKKPLLYNKENRFISTYLASGNLIGKIALRSANVNCNCQVVPDYYDTINKKFINYIEFKVDMEFDKKWSKEETDKYINEKFESKEWIRGYNKQVESELAEYMREKYFEHEKEIYIVLYNAMCAIDAPKTLVFPSKQHMQIIDNKYHHKVNFLQYKENRKDVINKQYYNRKNNLLDFFSDHIQDILLNIIENSVKDKPKFTDRSDILQKYFKNKTYCKETYDLCCNEVEKLYKEYTAERKKADDECNNKNNKLWRNRKFELEESQTWDDWREEEYQASREKNKKEKYAEYKKIDIKYIPEANSVIKTFDLDTIKQAISNLDKCTENFILSLFWKCFTGKNNMYVYQKCDDGDIEYLYEKYRKVEVKDFDNSKVVERIDIDDKVRLKLEQRIRFRLLNKSIVQEIEEALKSGQYDLLVNDDRVQAFDEFYDVIKDKEKIKVVKIDKLNEKSIGLVCEV